MSRPRERWRGGRRSSGADPVGVRGEDDADGVAVSSDRRSLREKTFFRHSHHLQFLAEGLYPLSGGGRGQTRGRRGPRVDPVGVVRAARGHGEDAEELRREPERRNFFFVPILSRRGLSLNWRRSGSDPWAPGPRVDPKGVVRVAGSQGRLCGRGRRRGSGGELREA